MENQPAFESTTVTFDTKFSTVEFDTQKIIDAAIGWEVVSVNVIQDFSSLGKMKGVATFKRPLASSAAKDAPSKPSEAEGPIDVPFVPEKPADRFTVGSWVQKKGEPWARGLLREILSPTHGKVESVTSFPGISSMNEDGGITVWTSDLSYYDPVPTCTWRPGDRVKLPCGTMRSSGVRPRMLIGTVDKDWGNNVWHVWTSEDLLIAVKAYELIRLRPMRVRDHVKHYNGRDWDRNDGMIVGIHGDAAEVNWSLKAGGTLLSNHKLSELRYLKPKKTP